MTKICGHTRQAGRNGHRRAHPPHGDARPLSMGCMGCMGCAAFSEGAENSFGPGSVASLSADPPGHIRDRAEHLLGDCLPDA
jgi:hypothetical protein